MSYVTRDGLAWDSSGLDATPIWAREPAVDAIMTVCRRELQLDDEEPCKISFYAEGSFNKLYLVETNERRLLIRLSLPVFPCRKTLGEVTTLRFLRRVTDMPVPEIVAFDDSNANEVGFEWILMEFMPGVPAYKRWRTLGRFQKVALIQRVAELLAQLYSHTFSGIGTLTASKEEVGHNWREKPGELVSGMFFLRNRYDYEIARGPFCSSHDWLASYLELTIKDQLAAIEEAEDEEDRADAEFALSLVQKLLSLLPKIFPALQSPPERTVLHHDDLSLNNFLLDDDGNISAILDWEFVSAMPLWAAAKVPKLLQGATRKNEPKREELRRRKR